MSVATHIVSQIAGRGVRGLMLLESEGFRVRLPGTWEGAIRRPSTSVRASDRSGRVAVTAPILHMSSAALPAVRGDFGSGAVDLLTDQDVFIAVVEFGADSRGTNLFETGPMPRRLRSTDFMPSGLQRTIPGQSGLQVFCTERGRPLCLYVVLGAHRRAGALVGMVNGVLAGLEVIDR